MKTATRSPLARNARTRPTMTVVFPTLLEVPVGSPVLRCERVEVTINDPAGKLKLASEVEPKPRRRGPPDALICECFADGLGNGHHELLIDDRHQLAIASVVARSGAETALSVDKTPLIATARCR